MTNRFPLIINNITGSIEELAANDNLDLFSSGIVNAGTIQATSFIGDGSQLASINGANVSTVAEATHAASADSVINSAQANITSLGALTELTVTGVVNLNSIDNLHITGGAANNVIITDGSGNLSWAAQSGGGGGGGSAGLQDIFLLGGM